MGDTTSRHLVLLGTGTSVGVPMIGCHCEVCDSDDPKNQRGRCGVAVEAPEGIFLIDTPPELRLQLVRERIDRVHAAVFTHNHADHVFGARAFAAPGEVPVYAHQSTGYYINRVVNQIRPIITTRSMRMFGHHLPEGERIIATISVQPPSSLSGRTGHRVSSYQYGPV